MNSGVAYVLGLVTATAGYYLYDRYFSTVYALGKSLYERAEGDVVKAYQHIKSLV